jgi:arylsulfatase A-like enzyme
MPGWRNNILTVAVDPMQGTSILLITSDQQHWNTLGIINPALMTPNLDRLAAAGTLFTRAYCPNPTCTPTRASIITGTYPSQHGAWSLGTKLPESEPTVGDVFRAAGYRTALVGKAHFQQLIGSDDYPSLESYPIMQDLDFWREFHGPFYGFDHVELARNHADEAHVGQHYAIWMEEKGCVNWRDYFRPPTGNAEGQRWSWPIPEEYHYNAWIADRTNALLERHQRDGKPFFLWASFFDPHPPYLVPEPWDSMYDPAEIAVPTGEEGEHAFNPPHFQLTQDPEPDFSAYAEEDGHYCHGFHSHLKKRDVLARDIAVYYGMISCMDKYIGQILDKLGALGLAENTLVVFTTDHGHFFGHHGLVAKGAFHYEDMIRIPFIATLPGGIPAGGRSAALQSLVDLAPTFLSFAGLDVPRRMTGVDQSNVWRGDADAARDHVIVENHHQPTTVHAKTYVNRRYKLTVYYNQGYGELFDLQEDPDEYHNRWDDPVYAHVKSELLLKFLHAEMGKEPLWMPRVAVA